MTAAVMPKKRISRATALQFALIGLLLLFIAVPLVSILANVRGNDFSYVFTDSKFGKAILYSLLYSGISAAIDLILAVIAAYCLSRLSGKTIKVIETILFVPMLIPTLSIGLGIRSMFGIGGFLDIVFGIDLDLLGLPGLIVGGCISAFPVILTVVLDTMRYENRSIYDATECMGVGKFRAFFHITLPYLRGALISAFFSGFTWIFADYGIPMEVAGKTPTLPVYLYEQVLTQFNYGRGAIVGIILLLPAVVAFVVDRFVKEGASEQAANQITGQSKSFKIAGYAYLGVVAFFLMLPQLCFIVLAFVKSFPNDLSFTFSHFSDGFSANAGLGISTYLWNSILMATLTAIIGTSLAFIMGYYAGRTNGKLGKILHFVAISSLAIPGLVYGIGYVYAFRFSKGWFYGTVGILVAVNIVHFLATPYLMARNALSKMDRSYEEVGETVGVSKIRVFFRVIVPNSVSTIVGMASFFFVNSMITISAVAFLCTYKTQPLSILINTFEKQGSYEMQAVVSFIIFLANILSKTLFGIAEHFTKIQKAPKEENYMALSRYQFDFLTYLERKGPGQYTQRQLADSLTVSLGLINKMMKEYQAENVIQISADRTISLTEYGYKLIAPYRVRKAIIIAAGFGSRLVPVTIDTPKPLVKVNGVRIIDTLLDALYEADIKSIYIVRGYKGEQFDQLLEKYPTIKFIDNPIYNESNNISSVYAAKDVIDRCYICEADLLIANPKIITKYQYSTNYLGCFVKETDDWCFKMRNGYINSVAIGGEEVEQMIGISYWDEKDSTQLRADIEKVFHMRGGKENYWDNVPLKICKKNYKIEVRECRRKYITEIDNYSELVMIDPSYENYKELKE